MRKKLDSKVYLKVNVLELGRFSVFGVQLNGYRKNLPNIDNCLTVFENQKFLLLLFFVFKYFFIIIILTVLNLYLYE